MESLNNKGSDYRKSTVSTKVEGKGLSEKHLCIRANRQLSYNVP